MRILLLSHGLPPENLGGVEQHVDGLAGALTALGCDVHVYARTDGPGRPQGEVFAERQGNPARSRVVYRWEGLQGLDDLYSVPLLDQALARFVQQAQARGERFDVAHVHHLTGMSNGSLEVLRQAGIPVVLTLHDYWLACARGQMFHHREEVCETLEPARCGACLQHTFPHWLGDGGTAQAARQHARARDLLLAADRLVVPSARVVPPFVGLGVPEERFHVVENGVDTETLKDLPLPACGPGPLQLGYLGTLLPSKGLHVLVDAVQRLAAGAVELHVAGNAVPYHGDTGYPLRVFSRLRPGDAVHYHGPYALADLPAVLAPLDVVCAPALWREAFGLTVRESLAAGRPVLASRTGGLQDSIVDGVHGLLLPPGDAAAWAAAIAGLAADRPRVRAMARHARAQARGFLPMARDLLAIYAELCAV